MKFQYGTVEPLNLPQLTLEEERALYAESLRSHPSTEEPGPRFDLGDPEEFGDAVYETVRNLGNPLGEEVSWIMGE